MMSIEEVTDAYARYQTGLGLDEVAFQLGTSYGNLHHHFRKHGLEMRTRGAKLCKPAEQFDSSEIGEGLARWASVPTNVKGAVAESRVQSWLAENGFDLWLPYSAHHRCDLGILSQGRFVRLQIKAATYCPAKHYFHVGFIKTQHGRVVRYAAGEVDFFIAYCGGLSQPEFYVIPGVEGMTRQSANLIPHRRKFLMQDNLRWEKYHDALSLLLEAVTE